MAKIITIANRKGGVAKTTTALCVGEALKRKGSRVLYVDMDSQQNTSATLRADANKAGAYDVLMGTADIEDAIQVTNENNFILPAGANLFLLEGKLKEVENKESRLKAVLEPVLSAFDYVVIDTPPALNLATINALACTDYVLIPCLPSNYCLSGAQELLEIIKAIKDNGVNAGIKVAGVLLTQFSARTNAHKYIRVQFEGLTKRYGTRLFNTSIRKCSTIEEAQIMRISINETAPKSNAVLDYAEATKELLKVMEGANNG